MNFQVKKKLCRALPKVGQINLTDVWRTVLDTKVKNFYANFFIF